MQYNAIALGQTGTTFSTKASSRHSLPSNLDAYSSFSGNPTQLTATALSCLQYQFAITNNHCEATTDVYLWNFDDPSSGSINNSNSVNPSHLFSSMGIYHVTLSITTGNGNNLAVYWFAIDVVAGIDDCDPCKNCPLSLTTASLQNNPSPAPGEVYCIPANITITNAVDFTQSEFRMDENVTITVAAGGSLAVRGSWLHGCEKMWKGIVVQNGGTINITNYPGDPLTVYSLIEDAENAVKFDALGVGSSSTTIAIQNTVFNRNYVSVAVYNYAPTSFPNLPVTIGTPPLWPNTSSNPADWRTYPVLIRANTFTSRELPANSYLWAQSPEVHAADNPISNALETPYINNTIYSPASLKLPHENEWPYAGVVLSGVGSEGANNTGYYQVYLGAHGTPFIAAFSNIYDNLHYGVSAYNANYQNVNSIFQNTHSVPERVENGFVFPPIPGAGIFAAQRMGRYSGLVVETYDASKGQKTSNHFYDCQYGILSKGYYIQSFSNCVMRSTQQVSNYLALANQQIMYDAPAGYFGIYCGTDYGGPTGNISARVTSNQMYNLWYGIKYVSSGPGTLDRSVSIGSNCISAALPGVTPTTEFTKRAIEVSHSGVGQSGTSGLRITKNNVVNAMNGNFPDKLELQPIRYQ